LKCSSSAPSTVVHSYRKEPDSYDTRANEKEIDSLPITVDPEIVSGTPVFTGTRVPINALITNLEAGLTLDEFLDNFPSVTRKQLFKSWSFQKALCCD
jgi:uncharacterized protein (DUF433 family)